MTNKKQTSSTAAAERARMEIASQRIEIA